MVEVECDTSNDDRLHVRTSGLRVYFPHASVIVLTSLLHDFICDAHTDPPVRPVALVAEHRVTGHLHLPQELVGLDGYVVCSASHLVRTFWLSEVHFLLRVRDHGVDVEEVVSVGYSLFVIYE